MPASPKQTFQKPSDSASLSPQIHWQPRSYFHMSSNTLFVEHETQPSARHLQCNLGKLSGYISHDRLPNPTCPTRSIDEDRRNAPRPVSRILLRKTGQESSTGRTILSRH